MGVRGLRQGGGDWQRVGQGKGSVGAGSRREGCPCREPTQTTGAPARARTGAGTRSGGPAHPGCTCTGRKGQPLTGRVCTRERLCVCARVWLGYTEPGLSARTRASPLPARPRQVTKALGSEGKQLGTPTMGDHSLPWEKPESWAEATGAPTVPDPPGLGPASVPLGSSVGTTGVIRSIRQQETAQGKDAADTTRIRSYLQGTLSPRRARGPEPGPACSSSTTGRPRGLRPSLAGSHPVPQARRGSHEHSAALPRGLTGLSSRDCSHQPLEGASTPRVRHSGQEGRGRVSWPRGGAGLARLL